MKNILFLWLLVALTSSAQDSIRVSGVVYFDANNDSVKQVGEPTIPFVTLTDLLSGNTVIANNSGQYSILVKNDSLLLSISNMASFQTVIPMGYKPILIKNTSGILLDSTNVNIPINCKAACHHLSIDLSSSVLNRCDTSNTIKVRYFNWGCSTANGAAVKVEIDTSIIDSIFYPFTFVKNIDQVFFNVGSIPPFSSGTIEFRVRVKCDVPSGISNCMRATITPYSTCLPPVNYDNSNLSLKIKCNNDTIIATVSNKSGVDMIAPAKIVIYEDIIVQLTDTIAIKNNQSKDYYLKLQPNTTSSVFVTQNINHPSQPVLIHHNEVCALKASGKVNSVIDNFMRYDDRSEFDESCDKINIPPSEIQKSVIPAGFTINHYTPTDARFSYRFDFKNAGIDTVKNIVIYDTLDPILDIKSFIPLNSSHTYDVLVINNNILKFTFNSINLPDSTHAPRGCMGYVQFYIVPRVLPAPNTLIKNKFTILYDSQPAKFSNTVVNHFLDTVFIKKGNNEVMKLQLNHKVYPNPAKDFVVFEFESALHQARIQLFDMKGICVYSKDQVNGNTVACQIGTLKHGNYIIKVSTNKEIIFNQKLIIE